MTDSLKLKGAIVASGLTRKDVAEQLNISIPTLRRKIYNEREFMASEISKLVKLLNLDNADIFFTNK